MSIVPSAARLQVVAWSLALLSVPAVAGAFDETGGDFSNDPNNPTPLAFVIGRNVVKGSVVTPGDTRDVVRFTIPPNARLTALRLGSYFPINTGFHALTQGAGSFNPDIVPAPAGMIYGSDHVTGTEGDGTDLLPDLSGGGISGTGFAIPLGPGTYSYLMQQAGMPLVNYSMEFTVTALTSAAVPTSGPAGASWLAAALLLSGCLLARPRVRLGQR